MRTLLFLFSLTLGLSGLLPNNSADPVFEFFWLIFLLWAGLLIFLLYRLLNFFFRIYFRIKKQEWILHWHIYWNRYAIARLQHRSEQVIGRLNTYRYIGEEVRNKILLNLAIWKDQSQLHQHFIGMYEKQLETLWQHREEIMLLHFTASELAKEPNTQRNRDMLQKKILQVEKFITRVLQGENIRLQNELRLEQRRNVLDTLWKGTNHPYPERGLGHQFPG